MVPAEQLINDPSAGQVLLVEDESVTRMMLADEAWSFLQACGRPDLVVSDIANPGTRNVFKLGVYLPKPYRLEAATKLRRLTARC
ncbi:MAG: response regulator [Proteobacteria bacterium]|nr:response regulator [Pseudomonadota bacterium]MBU6424993.1 response regulator [Rhodospirillales bacterium]